MIKHLRIKRKNFLRYFTLTVVLFILSNCQLSIDSIIQPQSAKVGDVITVTLNTTIASNADAHNKLIIGILAPKSWKLGQSSNAMVSFTSSIGDGTMTLIPATVAATGGINNENWASLMQRKLGIGPNYIDDMEWVPFQTQQEYSVPYITINPTITIKMKVGVDNKNTSVKLGYVICNDGNGLDNDHSYWGTYYSNCLSVYGGNGDLVDFCNPALTKLTPAKVLDNDYVSILFDNTITATSLAGATNTYICATAHTTDNQDITVCAQNDKTKMRVVSKDKYSITMWPRGFFNVPAGKTLASMDYFITDQTGNIKVGYGNTSKPFHVSFACE